MSKVHDNSKQDPDVTIEEVHRLLEIGRILLEVLTPEELEWLSTIANGTDQREMEIGNTSVT